MKEITKKALRELFYPMKVGLDDEDLERINEIVRSDDEFVYSPDTYSMFIDADNKTYNLSAVDTGFINALRNSSVEFRVKVMNLTPSEMELFIIRRQEELANQLGLFFKKKHRCRESDEFIDFKSELKDEYYCIEFLDIPGPTSLRKIINDVRNGKIQIAKAEALIQQLYSIVKVED